MPKHVPLVVTTRGDAVESVHYGSVAVTDETGRLLYALGDPDYPAFTRSTLKPFQAIPFVAADGPARMGFSPAHIALLCASHSGEPRHTGAVGWMLARAGFTAKDLQCGCHVPIFYAATGTAPPADLALTPLQHNCSGKHAGFLAWCALHGETARSYLGPHHPLQREVRRTVAELVDCAEYELLMGTDGCGAPNYALPLARLAHAYARLAAHPESDPYGLVLRVLFDAMVAHPEMVSGTGRNDLALMEVANRDWIAKGGAEGMQAIGVASRRIGIAIKIADGGSRALRVATASVLDRLGLLPPEKDHPLRAWRQTELRNYTGNLTGQVLPV